MLILVAIALTLLAAFQAALGDNGRLKGVRSYSA